VLDIEIEGARQLRAAYPDSVHVFVLPPSAAALVERLEGRNTEPADVVARRLRRAADELSAVAEYDYAVMNDDLTSAVGQVAAILDAEARRTSRQDGITEAIAQIRRGVMAEAERIAPKGELSK
jgi:guanylate kinase